MCDSILNLPDRIAGLPEREQARVRRLFEVGTRTGRLVVPESLAPKLARWYAAPGDTGPQQAIARASAQRVARTFNLYSGEGALFNELRARRPMQHGNTADLDARIEKARQGCDFCDPLRMTTADTWGRITGASSVSAANASMYDAHHGMVVFGEHHPHRFGPEQVADYLDVAARWLHRSREEDPTLRYPFIMWNCLEKAGASQPHGHLQMLLTRDRPYARQAWMIRVADDYHRQTNARYWDDWLAAHESLGLVRRRGSVACVASITPIKEKEMLVIGGRRLDDDFVGAVAAVLRCLIDRLGVLSFNVGLYLPPMDGDEGYDLPLIARCVDRGDPSRPTADVGAMELYGSPVVASDPYRVIEALEP
ncbi:MAG TPA: hypothetical protein PLC79_04955 [Phycisphaerae bacterium]|nr:hypothetical protein [Phycisphaerae bacterium]